MKGMTGSTSGSREERRKRLEVFAAYLLIPEDRLNEKLKEEWVKESPDPIPELAEEFQVSENFMRKRLKLRESSSTKA
jgi:Zn-dependent peptidase ImmA (M78 family)